MLGIIKDVGHLALAGVDSVVMAVVVEEGAEGEEARTVILRRRIAPIQIALVDGGLDFGLVRWEEARLVTGLGEDIVLQCDARRHPDDWIPMTREKAALGHLRINSLIPPLQVLVLDPPGADRNLNSDIVVSYI